MSIVRIDCKFIYASYLELILRRDLASVQND